MVTAPFRQCLMWVFIRMMIVDLRCSEHAGHKAICQTKQLDLQLPDAIFFIVHKLTAFHLHINIVH